MGRTDHDLLTTKLARPQIPAGYVDRPQISRMLDEGTQRRLTVVSAGAGWGKTLSTAAWAASTPAVGPVAWLSLDENDNHPTTFWSYLVAAIRSVVDVPASNPLVDLPPSFGVTGGNHLRLVAGLAKLEKPLVVVLDDFQVIHEREVLARVSDLVRRAPAQLRLVVLTRADPELPLHRLRLADDLAEIGAPELAFDTAEAVSLLATYDVAVDVYDADLLVERTEGWPAGLRLAAFFLKGPGPDRAPEDFAGDDRVVTDYLAEEVFASQPPAMRRFLTRTSIAERLDSGLAQVLADEPRSQSFLETLERSNAFVVGLGPDRRWYRYHPLLREMLRHQLAVEEPQIEPGLHRRAAYWFAENGYPVEALRHAAEAADWQLLGRLFVTHAVPRLVSAERPALDAVLARIPAERLADGPELALCAAGRLMYAGRLEEMQPHLELAASLLDRTDPESRIATSLSIQLLSTVVARARGDIPGLIAAASEVLDGLPGPDVSLPTADQYRAIALANLGSGLLWCGDFGRAETTLLKGLDVATSSGLAAPQIAMLAHLGLAAALLGRLRESFAYATKAVELVDVRGWAPLAQASPAYLALSVVHLAWNNVDEARRLLDRAKAAIHDRASAFAVDLAHVWLDASAGRVAAALGQVLRLREELRYWQPPSLLARWLVVTEAEVMLAAGDYGGAATRIGTPPDRRPPYAFERVTIARARLARGDLQEAEAILAELRGGVVERVAVVEVWLLSALVADRMREDSRAVDALARAVKAAAPDSIRGPFLALGNGRLPRLLTRLRQLDPSSEDFADMLLADLGANGQQGVATGEMSEPLTDRELSVLRYLPTMMTNAEIAAELTVSVNTIKAHLKRIYRKLGVISRREAVHRARELRLLSGDPT